MELETVHLVSLVGFLGAVIFGAVANKTHFCTMGAISDWINMSSKIRMRAWLLAMGLAMIGNQVMYMMGWYDLSTAIYLTPSLGWLGYVVGGTLFGIGMTLGAGCGQRTLVRVGGGNLKSLMVLLILAISAYATLRGILALVRIDVFDATNIDLAASGFENQGIPHLLASWTGLAEDTLRIIFTVLVGGGAVFYAFKGKDFRSSFDNILAGVVVGVLCAAAWYVTGVLGADDFDPQPLEGISFISPVGNALNYLMTFTGSTIGFAVAVVFGMIAGSFLYAIITGTFRVETFNNKEDMINHLYAGVLMGFGGVLSFGCTIGQGVTGMSTLALGSVLALAGIVFGCALTLKMQYYMLDDGFWKSLRQSLADMKLLPG